MEAKYSNRPMLGLLFFALFFLTPLYLVYKPPIVLIKFYESKWPDVFWRMKTTRKVVALTIDDSPSEYTKEIMEILDANNASASFFVIGSYIPGHEDTLKMLIKGGHELANHDMYDERSQSLAPDKLRCQIEEVQSQIEKIYTSCGINSPAKYFRPGHGFFSSAMRVTLKEMGFKLILGDIFPFDPQIPFWRVNAHHILSMLRPGGIIICHDGRGWTAPMLRRVLPEMKKRGYQIVTLTELFKQ